jgi:acetyl-CoA carboxylase carboxyltransferase component
LLNTTSNVANRCRGRRCDLVSMPRLPYLSAFPLIFLSNHCVAMKVYIVCIAVGTCMAGLAYVVAISRARDAVILVMIMNVVPCISMRSSLLSRLSTCV